MIFNQLFPYNELTSLLIMNFLMYSAGVIPRLAREGFPFYILTSPVTFPKISISIRFSCFVAASFLLFVCFSHSDNCLTVLRCKVLAKYFAWNLSRGIFCFQSEEITRKSTQQYPRPQTLGKHGSSRDIICLSTVNFILQLT